MGNYTENKENMQDMKEQNAYGEQERYYHEDRGDHDEIHGNRERHEDVRRDHDENHGHRDHEGNRKGRGEGRRSHDVNYDGHRDHEGSRRDRGEGREDHEGNHGEDRRGRDEIHSNRAIHRDARGGREDSRGKRWRDPEEESITGLLRRCGHILFIGRGETRSQDRILYILERRGEMTQRELLNDLQIQPGSLSEILTKLENGGYLTRERDEGDRRCVILRITDSGRARAKELKAVEDWERYSALTEEEQETLRRLLCKVLKSWKEKEEQQNRS